MSEIHGFTIFIIVIVIVISALMGALVQAAISAYTKRTQAIGRRVDVFPAFEDTLGTLCQRQNIKISDGCQEYTYDQLRIVQLQLTNQGDYSFKELQLGITFPDGAAAVYVEVQVPNRHHQVEQITPLSFEEPKTAIDFILRPLNKKGTYSLRLLTIVSEEVPNLEDIKFTSSQDVEFVNLPTATEILEEAVRSTKIGIGPFSLSFSR